MGDPIVIITHKDLDGVACAVVLLCLYPGATVIYCDYRDIDETFREVLEVRPDDQFFVTLEESADPAAGNIIDAVCWSNDDGGMTEAERDDGNDLITKNQWGDPTVGLGTFTTVNQGPAIGDINDGYAQRSDTGDSDDVGDWTISGSHSHGTGPAAAARATTGTSGPRIRMLLQKTA